ncbi:MAG: cation:proton antiporter [Nanoarchaeota archaeon]|nr:cation:proton antiporter [Nanoarchaeota archaeon]
MAALFYLTAIAGLLLAGIICSIISNKLKIPNVLLLILTGILLGNIKFQGDHMTLSPVFLTSISIIALVMILFDSTSRLKLKTFDTLSFKAMKLAFVFLILNTLLLTIPAMLIYGIAGDSLFQSVILALIFSALMSATDSAAVLILLKGFSGKVARLLEIESIINTPLSVILPFLFLDLFYNIGATINFSTLVETSIIPFLTQIIVGLGSGIFIGLLIFKLMRKKYSDQLSPIALITSALLTYIIAENLSGSGVIAVVALGLFFGNITVKEKSTLNEFSSMFSNSLEILVFILIGFSIAIPFDIFFFIRSILLFLIYLVIRYIAVNLTFKDGYTKNEKLFMSLNISKGITVAVVIFSLMTLNIPALNNILPLILIFMVYSIATSTLAGKFAPKLLTKPE